MKYISFILLLFVSYTISSQNFLKLEWEYVETINSDLWNIEKLEEAYKYVIDSTSITGLVVVHNGKIIVDYGNIEDNSYIASCRKSIVAMLYGPHIKSGKVNLHKTLNELELDDLDTLMTIERKASIKDIISARSGVFHKASNRGDFLHYAPKRGSVKPGSYWLYSNWDFNIAEHILEIETKTTIYDQIEKTLVIPLHMEDWNKALQQTGGNNKRSKYLAHHIWFSTRDMARIGLLMLNKGKWNTLQIIDEQWVDEMISLHTTSSEINKNVPFFRDSGIDFGYGYMWWIWANRKDKRQKGAYSAMGAFGQSITVFPELNLVIAYKTNSDYQRSTSTFKGMRLLEKISLSHKKL